MSYPIELKKYICSDGRIFNNEEEAIRWQEILDKHEPSSYSASPDDEPFEMRFNI